MHDIAEPDQGTTAGSDLYADAESPLPTQPMTSSDLAQMWSQITATQTPIHAHPDHAKEFKKFWQDHSAKFTELSLQMQPCGEDPSAAIKNGAELVRGIVKRMPSYANAAAAAPQIEIVCNEVADNASDDIIDGVTLRLDLAYCG